MSDFWANNIGAASAAGTSTGSVPQYGLNFDIGTAPWEQETFNVFAQDEARRSRRQSLRRAQQLEDEEKGWFQKATGAAFGALAEGVGFLAQGFDGNVELSREASMNALKDVGAAEIPGTDVSVMDIGRAADRYVLDPIETPIIASTMGYRDDNAWWFTDSDTWSRAWRMAETKTPGQAMVDWVVNGFDPSKSNRDLNRMARTNSLYGAAALAGDLALTWKLDPTVLAAKGVGEWRAVHGGFVPRGQSSAKAAAEARRVLQGEKAYRGLDPLRQYGAMRGKQIASNWDGVREAARTWSFADFSNMQMFRHNTTGGPQMAYALKLAANDDELWDLTTRASFADPKAWEEIRLMKEDPDHIRDAYGVEAPSYINAIDSIRTNFDKLENELKGLEKDIANANPASSLTGRTNPALFKHYQKELHSTYEQRLLDLQGVEAKLKKDQAYTDWLDAVPSLEKATGELAQVKAKPASMQFLNRRTYQSGLYSPVHRIQEVAKGGVLREANPIDFHRTEIGTMSIRRQFEQFQHFFGYNAPEAMDDVLTRFTQAMVRDDKLNAYKVAKEIEEVHLVNAIQGWSRRVTKSEDGIDSGLITRFLNETRFRQNQMAQALLSGDGAVYSTAPGVMGLGDEAKLLEVKDGKARIKITDGDKVDEIVVPEETLKGMLPVDPTQTPNWYTPQNTRQLYLAMKREPDLWKEMDSQFRRNRREFEKFVGEGVDVIGTKWNQFWKPFQLFRLAWPQRVLMDEDLRGMALLGVSAFARNYGNAFRMAGMNAVNPLEHPGTLPGMAGFMAGGAAGAAVAGPFGLIPGAIGGAIIGGSRINPLVRAKRLQIGPGPLADEVTGRIYSPKHEAKVRAAKVVPAPFAPVLSKKRQAALQGHWNSPYEARYNKVIKNHDFSESGFVVVDPVTGKRHKSGYTVPIHTERIPSTPIAMKRFVAEQQELLGSKGYRLMVKKVGDDFEVSVVHHFPGTNPRGAATFAYHAETDFMTDLNDGGLEYAREWLDQDTLDNEAALAASDEVIETAVVENIDNFDSLIDAQVDRARFLRRREFGTGTARLKSRDGRSILAKAALEAEGAAYVPLMSGAPAYARLTDAYKRTLAMSRGKAVGYKRYAPPKLDPETLRLSEGRKAATDYFTTWADLLNDQIRNSPIWFRMLDGKTDEQIVEWLTRTAEGNRVRRQIPHKGYNPEKWVEEHRQALNFYLPNTNLQKMLREGRLNPSQLRRGIPDEDLPEVFGADLEMIDGGTGLGKWWGNMVERTYNALGTTPTDILSRQPFFKSMYDLKMRNLVAAREGQDLTQDVMRAYEKLSREFALRQVKRHMFDLSDETNMTQMVRFMAPFWGAQQEAILKWGNIVMERPETLARFYVGIETVYEHFQVINEDGEPSKGGFMHYDPNDRVLLQIPDFLKKVAPFDKMLDAFGTTGVAFGAANTALQGENFFLPSLGPIVTAPADVFVNAMWDTHATQFDDNFFYRWLFPVGRPQSKGFVSRTMEMTFPGWAKRMLAVQQGQDGRAWTNTYVLIQREMMRDAKKKGLPPPTPKEIEEAAKWHFALRIMASFAAPAAMEFRPKNQFFLDQYHKMQRQYGPSEAFERFVEKFGPDAARYAASSSSSMVPPTAQGMAEWDKNKVLIEKYRDWGSAMISPDAWADDFSSDAYGAQFNIPLGPGTSDPIREFQDARTRQEITETRLGWLEYRKLSSAIDAELFARGLTSIQSSGAEDIAAAKRAAVAQLFQQYPAFEDDYGTFSNTVYKRVRELNEWAWLPRFDKRPDIQGVRQYLEIRKQATDSLDAYAEQTGGSRSLQAEENVALRQWFYTQVGQLIQDNPSFGEFYARYLDSDSLERGSGP